MTCVDQLLVCLANVQLVLFRRDATRGGWCSVNIKNAELSTETGCLL